MSRFLQFIRNDLHPDEVRMTLGEHLEELRSRVVRALAALVVGAILCYVFIDYVMGFLTSPVYAVYRRHGLVPEVVTLSPPEAIITDLKVAMIVGFIATAPYSLSQLWGFVAAGLYPNERRWVYRFAPTSIALFFLGVFFLLLVVNPLLLDFLLSYRNDLPRYQMTWMLGVVPAIKTDAPNVPWPATQPIASFTEDPSNPPEMMPWVNLQEREIRMRIGPKTYTISHLNPADNQNQLRPMMRLSEYILFILELSAAFGISFQVPVVVAFIVTLRIASAKQIGSFRRYIWFIMCIAAAVITPTTDLASLFLLLAPMVALLELGLLAGRAIERARGEGGKT